MIVKKLDIWHLRLGFLSPIKHNLATHEGSDNLVLRVTTDDGITGFGEGVPRAFVTGEVLSDSLSVPPAGPGPGNISPGVSFPPGAAPRPQATSMSKRKPSATRQPSVPWKRPCWMPPAGPGICRWPS